MQIATGDCTDEWKSKLRDQPELFSLLSSEIAHQHLHRLQKPDEQAKSREKAWGFYDPFHNHRATLSKDILAFTSPLSGGRDVNAFVQKP
jgi:hypothetical protein